MTDQPTTPAQMAVKPLLDAMAQIKNWSFDGWQASAFEGAAISTNGREAIATILNAVASGAIIPAPAPAEQEPVAWITNCCVCGRIIDTREMKDGGDEFGAAVDGDRWACSSECWHEATDAAHPVPAVPDDVAGLCGALLSGEQADMDGCRVKVSRQACEEGADTIEALATGVARLTEQLAQVKGLLEEAREWNWIDLQEDREAGDEAEAFLPDLCRLDAEITAALTQPNLQLYAPKLKVTPRIKPKFRPAPLPRPRTTRRWWRRWTFALSGSTQCPAIPRYQPCRGLTGTGWTTLETAPPSPAVKRSPPPMRWQRLAPASVTRRRASPMSSPAAISLHSTRSRKRPPFRKSPKDPAHDR